MTYDNFSTTFAKSRKNMHWPEMEYFMESCKPGPADGAGLAPDILDV
jgi:hypothetical protein